MVFLDAPPANPAPPPRCAWQAYLLYDWASSASNDYSLRLNLNRLRSGYFAIASLKEYKRTRPKAAGREHAD